MASTKPITTLRMQSEIREKLRYLANREHRSINAEIEYCIEYYIEAWEGEHGEIPVAKPTE